MISLPCIQVPHDSLKNNMRLLIDETFKVRGAVYLLMNKSIFSRYEVNVKRHILEGICQPLAIRRSMSRRVTTRRPTCKE